MLFSRVIHKENKRILLLYVITNTNKHVITYSIPTNSQDVFLNGLKPQNTSFLVFFLSVAAGTMLPRNMRTGGYDLPGVESSQVPLIGYRPLPPDGGAPSVQSGRGSGSDELETSQVSVFLFPHWNTSIILSPERVTQSDMKLFLTSLRCGVIWVLTSSYHLLY